MYFSAFEMQSNFDERSHPLAQISDKARRMAQEVDANLTDALSLMELNFSFDGFGRLCNDLGKTCDISNLAKIPAKCVDLAKKFADEVSADWLGLDIKPTDIESVKITCENVEASNDKSEEEHDDLAISGVPNNHSESTNSSDAFDHGSDEKPLSVCTCHCGSFSVVPGESKYAVPGVCGYHLGSSSAVPGDKTDKITAEADNLISLPVIVNSVDQNALVEVSKSHDGNSTLGSSDKTIETALVEVTKSQEGNLNLDTSDNTVETALVDVSKSHEGNSALGLSDKTVETAAEADNLVNFSKSIEFGGFEDVDLKDDWEDDTDYDLNLLSYFDSQKKSSKKKLAAKFISRLRNSMKSQSVEVAQKPDVKSTDSDWEFL